MFFIIAFQLMFFITEFHGYQISIIAIKYVAIGRKLILFDIFQSASIFEALQYNMESLIAVIYLNNIRF